MRSVLVWLGYTGLAIAGLFAAVFAFYRLRGASSAQRDALALMQRDYRPTQGSHAFARLWYIDYDVADAALETTLAHDIAELRKRAAAGKFTGAYEPSASKLLEVAGDTSRLCEVNAHACLDQISADPAAMRATLASYPILLSREAAVEHSDYLWNPFMADFGATVSAAAATAQRVWLSAIALRFVEGEQQAALAGVCSNIATWRRLRAGTNSLIASMLGSAYADGGLRLLAEMLAKAPDDMMMPAACGAALRPVAVADLDRCAEMSGEFASSTSLLDRVFEESRRRSWWDALSAWGLFDETQSAAWRAESYAAHCGEAADARLLADLPERAQAPTSVTRRLECLSSLSGCILADIAAPVYADYDARALDFAAHLRLAATLLWLRDRTNEKPTQSIGERYAQRPPALRSGHRESGYDAARGVIFVQNLRKSHEPRFELPFVAVH